MAVHFKFRSAVEFDSVDLEGPSISVFHLKQKIADHKNLRKCEDFDLVITNAQTGEVYNDDEMLVPKDTSVIIKRVPSARPKPTVVLSNIESLVEASSSKNTNKDDIMGPPTSSNADVDGFDDFGVDLYAVSEQCFPKSDMEESNKMPGIVNKADVDSQRQPQSSQSGGDEGLGGLGSLYGTEKYHHHTNNNNNNDDDDKSSRSGLASDSAAQRMTECGPSEDGDGSLGWVSGRIKVEGQEEEDKAAQSASDARRKVEPREASDAKVKVEEPDEAWDTIELTIDYNEFEEEEEEELDDYQEPDPEVAPLDIKLRGDRVHEDLKINLALDSIFGPPPPTDFNEDRKLISLRLNYDDVLTAWSDRGSPWACGRRLETASDDCSSDGAGLVPDLSMPNGQAGEQGELGQVPVTNNGGGHGGREARVLRYREKRRTRLFSKKIRYEVRKLNAEKRPRMKGRFVKRTSSMCSD